MGAVMSTLTAAALVAMVGCGGSAGPARSAVTAAPPTSTRPLAPASTVTTTVAATSTTVAGTSTTDGPTVSGEDVWATFGAAADRRGAVGAGPNPAALVESWASDPLDGDLYGEPLVAGGRVFVATEHDSVYAFALDGGRALWHASLGEPIAGSALECGNIDPSGVTGTPVLDPRTGTLYVVAFVQPGRHDLVALDVRDGSIRWRRPADVAGLDPLHEQQRSALTIANGQVYVAYGGLFGDCGPYKGAVISFSLDGTGEPRSWVVPTTREGGIWAPSGPTVDASGDLFVALGNAASTDPHHFDDGNAVVRLHPDLTAVDVWAPADWYSLSARDGDLGSIGPLPLANGRIFVAGKNGTGYILGAAHLGGVGGELTKAAVCDGGAFGGSATNGSIVVVGCTGGPVGLDVGNGSTIATRWHGPVGRSGAPVIAGDAAWLITNSGHLYALNVTSGATRADIDLHSAIKGFPTPTVLPHAVLVPAGKRLIAYTAG